MRTSGKTGDMKSCGLSLNFQQELFSVEASAFSPHRSTWNPVESMGKGMKSIYMLSLLETYIGEPDRIPSLIMVEDPEIYLHPQLQKTCSEILYRLSKKNQVIFKTHAPAMLLLILRPGRFARWYWMTDHYSVRASPYGHQPGAE